MSCDNLGWKHSLCMLEASDGLTVSAYHGRDWLGARLNNQPQYDAMAVSLPTKMETINYTNAFTPHS